MAPFVRFEQKDGCVRMFHVGHCKRNGHTYEWDCPICNAAARKLRYVRHTKACRASRNKP